MLLLEPYLAQQARWPQTGRHILAQYDERSVVVYQAYSPSIGRFAAQHGYLGGEHFSFSRMSWIKPNFLWMMYRSGWGTKPGQEVTLAVRLKREAFDAILAAAVATSDVRLQWDPDHEPRGTPLPRRAIQLGLRGETLASYARDWIIGIEELSAFVAEQRARMRRRGRMRGW